jgi:hypothetical protein
MPNDFRYFTLYKLNNKYVQFGRVKISNKSGKPLDASKKLLNSICEYQGLTKNNKLKCKAEFYIRETTKDSNKKIYGPYKGYFKKYKTPVIVKLKDGKEIKHKMYPYVIKIKDSLKKQFGGSFNIPENIMEKDEIIRLVNDYSKDIINLNEKNIQNINDIQELAGYELSNDFIGYNNMIVKLYSDIKSKIQEIQSDDHNIRETTFVSVGNTPYKFTRLIELFGDIENINYKYIPYSGKFYHENTCTCGAIDDLKDLLEKHPDYEGRYMSYIISNQKKYKYYGIFDRNMLGIVNGNKSAKKYKITKNKPNYEYNNNGYYNQELNHEAIGNNEAISYEDPNHTRRTDYNNNYLNETQYASSKKGNNEYDDNENYNLNNEAIGNKGANHTRTDNCDIYDYCNENKPFFGRYFNQNQDGTYLHNNIQFIKIKDRKYHVYHDKNCNILRRKEKYKMNNLKKYENNPNLFLNSVYTEEQKKYFEDMINKSGLISDINNGNRIIFIDYLESSFGFLSFLITIDKYLNRENTTIISLYGNEDDHNYINCQRRAGKYIRECTKGTILDKYLDVRPIKVEMKGNISYTMLLTDSATDDRCVKSYGKDNWNNYNTYSEKNINKCNLRLLYMATILKQEIGLFL